MKQTRPATQPVVYLWLLDAKFSYYKSLLASDEGKKMRSGEKIQLVLEILSEFEKTYAELPQEKVNVWYAKMCDVLNAVAGITQNIGKPQLAMPLIKRTIGET